ncbi:hypothetical protein MMC12_006952 [Toensbergia leucococca]|nr:hypothetical protein [Toensbergia leucococca]
MPKLHVAMYRPAVGNYEHWALYFENRSEHKIYEVTGEHPHFKPNVIPGKPTSTNRHRRTIFVSDINETDIPEFEKAISAVKPQNSISHWNCQDYVIEVLEKLEEECVVDEDNKAYISAKKQVKKHYGPL